ncbi:MAG TPA: isochorismatase family protein [Chloroflexota bacterium]|nr:isochorismatase family protein [Chloroflexota bacterium]
MSAQTAPPETVSAALGRDASTSVRELRLMLRTYQRSPESGRDWVESSFHYETWPVTIAAREAAVVLVDVWDRHVITSHAARTAEIARSRIAPALAAARTAGIAVIHAPSPVQARRYPQWTRYAGESDATAPAIRSWPFMEPSDDWPPPAFRRREGPFAQFRRPSAATVVEPRGEREGRAIDPSVEPQPGDFVVATGEQLHRLCAARGILHLFYAGFAANICIPFKDYGMRAFHARGYHTVLLRDCTTAIEGHDTVDGLAGTRQAIRELEMAGIAATITSDDLVAACALSTKGEAV